MKKLTCVLLSCVIAAASAWGQTTGCRGGMCVADENVSGIDLLQQSLQSSSQSVQGVASSAPRKPATKQETSAEKAESSSQQAEVKQEKTAAPSPSQAAAAVPAKPAAAATQQGSLLDMPLTVGGQTQSVQTAVPSAPQATKQLSPAAAKRVEEAKKKREQAAQKPAPTDIEQAIEKDNSLLPPSSKQAAAQTADTASKTPEEEAADAELEYAVKMMEESKKKATSSGRRILPSASKNRPSKVPSPNKAFNPNAYRPGVVWEASKSNHFDIYTQKRDHGISSPNMSMTFESAYQTLRRFIPWMMSGRVRVFVYQDRASYLRHEPNAIAWSRAVAYPTRGEIVVYDEPKKKQELQESFTHELTHIFTQQFFDSHKTGKLMTPLWLDEGLAIMMEDHAYNGSKGGPWADDFNTLNFQRSPNTKPGSGMSSWEGKFGSGFGRRFPSGMGKRQGKPLYFVPFDKFMQEDSLQLADSNGNAQDWYFQAYTMVRFLLNPSGSSSPSNRIQFEQFTRLLSQGEPQRDPVSGFLRKDKKGKTIYEPYSVEKAMGKVYRYSDAANFEDAFWRWANKN